jgi:alpha-L-fucosidase
MSGTARPDHEASSARVVPLPRQVAYHRWERGLFFHFGLLTFYGPEYDKSYGKVPMDPGRFNPASLDCARWASLAKQSGFNYMVLTTKHHDGFCTWPSALTAYSVASSPWKGGKGDVVGEFVAACRANDLRIGFYYSPFDINEPSYAGDPPAYDRFFTAQMRELLSNYGPIDILWFDGAHSEGHAFNWEMIVSEIRSLQPEILIFNSLYPDLMMFDNGHPDLRWVGNEDGFADIDCRNVIESTGYHVDERRILPKRPRWLVPECDIRMRRDSWFNRGDDDEPVKPLDELMGIYYASCGRGCNLLLNIGPDRRGMLPDKDVGRLQEFGAEIRARFGTPFARIADCTSEGRQCTWTSPSARMVDHVVVGEDVSGGERVRRFAVVVETANTRARVVMHEGGAIGYRRICRFPAIRTHKVWIEVVESDGDPRIAMMDLCYSGTGGA